MNKFLPLVFVLGCSTPTPEPSPDAGLDAGLPDSIEVDAGEPPCELPQPTVTCAELCPDEMWFPTYNPTNSCPYDPDPHYQWSYCLPSFQRCIDPSAPWHM